MIYKVLSLFIGRCRFRIYLPNKPGKFGLKIQNLVDSRTCYTYNAYIYCGKGSDGYGLTKDEQKLSVPTQSLIKLTSPIQHTDRNVFMDNWYCSLESATELKERGLNSLGTMRKNRKGIPSGFGDSRGRSADTSRYLYSIDGTILSYAPKKNRTVVLFSNIHEFGDNDPVTSKPEIVQTYNTFKSGVDVQDYLTTIYSCRRKTNRWPLALFFAILNIAAVNSYVIYQFHHVESQRPRFLKYLAIKLMIPYMEKRLTQSISNDLHRLILDILNQFNPTMVSNLTSLNESLAKDEKCNFCPKPLSRRNRTRFGCKFCFKPLCGTCAVKVCKSCINK